MRERIAFVYVRFLFVAELLLFTISICLHLGTLAVGPNEAFQRYGLPLFHAAILVGAPVTSFIKDGMWHEQIRSCPKWMWKSALGFGLYSLVITCLQVTLAPQANFSEQTMAISGFPLGFEAISLCILYTVLWSGYFQKGEVVRHATRSAIFVTLGIIVFWAYNAGYLHSPNKVQRFVPPY